MNFQILGRLRVIDGEQREIALGGVKRAAVLAVLLVHPNEVVTADRLIEELWEGAPPPTAAKSLQVHVSRLRRALGGNGDGGPIVTTASGYMLEVDPDDVDALRFERLVAEGRAALGDGNAALASTRLRAALELWRGDALADFAYSSFAQEPVARLDGLRTVALEGAVEAELELGRHAELIPELKSLVRQYPLSERLRGQLMLALYRSGRQAEALGVYRAGRRLLVDQLGIEPGVELRELERAILAQDPGLEAPAPERERRRERAPGAPGGLLVGYEPELSALEDMLERALVGQGRVALLSGEPGVGKTRLADELGRVARARGADVFWARCWNGGGAPAFWPWTQVLRALVADRDPAAVRAELGDRAGDLVQLLPELGGGGGDLGDPQEARFRLFEATAAVVRRAALARPLVLVFDDLHAADPATLALLGFMATGSPDWPVLLVGTYRDTDVAGNDALVAALTELTRSSDCVQLVLTGLAREDTAHFVELSSGIAPMTELAAAIQDASAGNPLFVSELVRLLQAEGRLAELERGGTLVLPRGIDQVIARRLQQLSVPTRSTLAHAAVIGTEFDLVVLEHSVQAAAPELLEQLEEAQAARIVETVNGGGRLRFSHDLVRQSLYGSLKASERSEAHLAVAGALEPLGSAAVADLAYHYAEALPFGDAATAIRYASLAVEAAADVLAYEDAAAHYRRAIDIATARDADPLFVSELYIKLAEQCVKLMDAPSTAEALDKAEAAVGVLPPALQGRADLTRAEYDLFDACVSGRERVEEVAAMFRELGDVANEARAVDALAMWHHGHSRLDDAYQYAQRAVALAEQSGSHSVVQRAYGSIAASLGIGSWPVSEAEPRLRALLPKTTNPGARARVFVYLASLRARSGRFEEMRSLLHQAEEAVGDSQYISCAAAQMTMNMELVAGNPVRAEAVGRTSCAFLEERGLTSYLSTEVAYLAQALIAQGKLDEAEAELTRGATLVMESDIDALFRQARARASLLHARGDLEGAEASVREALGYLEQMQFPSELIATQLLLAEILTDVGRLDEARPIAEEALAGSEAIEHKVYADQARELLASAALV